jgi:pimeloyl-ACP methyl ester carboxylesterase
MLRALLAHIVLCCSVLQNVAGAAPYGEQFAEYRAADEPYLARCAQNPQRILLYLHSWSADYQQVRIFPELEGLRGACVLSPNFNGQNSRPSACGSSNALDRIAAVIREARRLTGLQHVDLLGFSGGAYAGLMFIGTHPGQVSAAGIWLPIYDLARWFAEGTNGGEFRADMVACIGHAPSGPEDTAYGVRSPSRALNAIRGPLTIWINAASRDVTTFPWHAEQAYGHIRRACPTCEASYVKWDMIHEFRMRTALRQLGYATQ